VAGGGKRRAQQRAFVLAEQLLDAPQRDWIDVPGVPGDVGDLIDPAVVRRVEPVVHARGQPQRHVSAIGKSSSESVIAEQIRQCVGKSLDLVGRGAGDAAARADDRVTWTDENLGAAIDRARTVLELADEAIVQAAKVRFFRFAQIEIGKETPQGNREVAHQRLLDLAEPAHELRGQPTGDPVGEQEVEIFLLHEPQKAGPERHRAVTCIG
jgi:hypothetical protein